MLKDTSSNSIRKTPIWLQKLLKSRYEAAILSFVVEECELKKTANYYKLYWEDLYRKASRFQKTGNMHIAIQFNQKSLNSLTILRRSIKNDKRRINDIRNKEILEKYRGQEKVLFKKAIQIFLNYTIKQRTVAHFYDISLEIFNREIIKYETSAEAYYFGEPIFLKERFLLEQIAKEQGCQGLGSCQYCIRIRLPFIVYNYAIEKHIRIPYKWKNYKSASPNWLNKFMIKHEQIIKELFPINSCQSGINGLWKSKELS